MIESVIRDVVNRTRASDGDNLTGFVIDLDHALFQSGLAEDARIIRSGDDLSMLNVPIDLPSTFTQIAQVSQALTAVLMDVVYNTFHAAAFAYYDDAASLRFVTAVPESGLRVTATLVIIGPAYVTLSGKSERGKAPYPGGLPAWVA